MIRQRKKTLGIYIHLPFCRQKCGYCDFYSLTDPTAASAYTDALCRHIALMKEKTSQYTVDTVFFGGGTPTLLDTKLLLRIFEALYASLPIAEDAEITLEANPATVTEASLTDLRDAGMNRISFGVQSSNATELSALGRIHTFRQAAESVELAHKAGISQISLDLMYGIPNQTPDSFRQSIADALALSPTHLSVYGLKIEDGTPFAAKRHQLLLPNEETERSLWFFAIELLEQSGFAQYEISNFARTGAKCRHNLKYWNAEPYLGFGAAAHSDFDGVRYGYRRDAAGYIHALSQSEQRIPSALSALCTECATPSPSDRRAEYVMLRMRLKDGVSAAAYHRRFGRSLEADFGEGLSRFLKGGFVCQTEDGYAFSREGMYVSNYILSEILTFEE